MSYALPILSRLVPRAAEFDASCPIPRPSSSASSSQPVSPQPSSEGRSDSVPIVDPFPQAETVVSWIDAEFDLAGNSGHALARLAQKQSADKVVFVPHKSLAAFTEWFDQNGVATASRLKVVMASYYQNDGHERAAEHLLTAIDGDPKKRGLPVLIFCRDARSVQHLTKRGAIVTTDTKLCLDFCLNQQ